MKHYKRVLELFGGCNNWYEWHNCLIDIGVLTEDEWLQDLIRANTGIAVKFLDIDVRYLEPLKSNYKKAYMESAISLKHYCEQTIKAAKPEWQKVAERKGWSPANRSLE